MEQKKFTLMNNNYIKVKLEILNDIETSYHKWSKKNLHK